MTSTISSLEKGGFDISTSQGLANLQTLLSDVGTGLKTLATNVIDELVGDADIPPPNMGDFDSELAQAQTVFSNALNSTAMAVDGGSKTNPVTLFNNYVLQGDSNLALDVQSDLQEAQAQVGTADTLANGLIVTDNADGTTTYTVTDPNNAPSIASFTQTQDVTGAVISTETEYTNGTSEYTLVNPDDGSVRTVDYSGANGTGTVTRVDEEYGDGTSEIILISNHVATTTSYTEANGVGTATVEAVEYELPESNAGVTNPDMPSQLKVISTSFASIASAAGLNSLRGAVVVAAMNGSARPEALYQGAEAYVPSNVGAAVGLPPPVPAPPENGEPSTASRTWAFARGGILVMGVGGGSSFTPLSVSGTDDPQNAVYVMNTSAQLIDVLDQGQGATVTITVTDTPAQPDGNGGMTQASTETTFEVYPNGAYGGTAAEYSVSTDSSSGLPQAFTPALSNYGLPFFDASTAGTSADAVLSETIVGGGYADLATFNSISDTPDSNWTIGVNGAGDAVIGGNTATGFTHTVALTQGEAGGPDGNATPLIGGVELGQQVYGLQVIPNAGLKYGLDGSVLAEKNIIAEGTGTSVIDLTDYNFYWHVNGKNDQITVDIASTDEFYFSGTASSYKTSFDGVGDLTVTGGTTGSTVFKLGNGVGEINFSDGTTIGLGGNYSSGIDDSTMYGGQDAFFDLSGGTQRIEAALASGQPNSEAYFETGDDIPDSSWTITESANPNAADADKLLVTCDGTNAGYDGVATLGGISTIELNDRTYQLEAVATNGALNLGSSNSGDSYLIVDKGGVKLDFTSLYDSYWHVGGVADSATLGVASGGGEGGVTDIYFSGAQSQYTITKTPKLVTVKGGTTGVTRITLAGGSGNLIFGDGSTIAIGAAAAIAAELHLDTQLALLNQHLATNHGSTGAFNTTPMITPAETPHTLLAAVLHG